MDYQSVIQQAKHKNKPLKEDRFVSIGNRLDKCDIPTSVWQTILDNTYLQTWKGMILNKGITEIALYPMLLFELQPKTIIEIGALNGGSAIWLADNLDIFNIEGSVYSIDINLSLLDEKAKTDSRVSFIEGDCHNLSAVLPPELLDKFPHPWLVIEDAHVNTVGVVEYFHCQGLQSGDYLIVEDTNKFMWDYWAQHWEDKEEVEQGMNKIESLKSWLINHQDEYLVDSYYQDMYGYNGSKNWNSILKRV